MVFQNYALFPHMTVNENCISVEVRGRQVWREANVRKALDMVQMGEFETAAQHNFQGVSSSGSRLPRVGV